MGNCQGKNACNAAPEPQTQPPTPEKETVAAARPSAVLANSTSASSEDVSIPPDVGAVSNKPASPNDGSVFTKREVVKIVVKGFFVFIGKLVLDLITD